MKPSLLVFVQYNNMVSLHVEEWRDITDEAIEGIEPYYSISSYGRIFNKQLGILAPQYNNKGYRLVNIRLKNGKILSRAVHRLVKLVFDYFPGCESLDIDHVNCIKDDNYLYNLDWVTCHENILRAHQNNLCSIGEDNTRSIFTNEEVHMICNMLVDGIPIKDIATTMEKVIYPRQYAKMKSTIYGILYRECWVHISKDYIFAKYNDYNFSDEQVIQICKYLENGLSYDEILGNLGYNRLEMELIEITRLKNTISNIRNKRNYSNISNNYIFEDYDKRNYNDEQARYICDCIKNTKMSNAEIFDSMKLNIDPKFRKKYIGTINDIRHKKCYKYISDEYF